jgi:hypothetical protein
MKRPSLLIICLAMVPVLAWPQGTPVAGTNASAQQNRSQIQKRVSEVSGPAAIAVRTPEWQPQNDASPGLAYRSAPNVDVSAEQKVPQVSLGKSHFTASGFLVTIFRPSPPAVEQGRQDRTFLGVPITNIFAVDPGPKSGWQREYLKWGERTEPWSVVCERARPEPQSVLLAIHF